MDANVDTGRVARGQPCVDIESGADHALGKVDLAGKCRHGVPARRNREVQGGVDERRVDEVASAMSHQRPWRRQLASHHSPILGQPLLCNRLVVAHMHAVDALEVAAELGDEVVENLEPLVLRHCLWAATVHGLDVLGLTERRALHRVAAVDMARLCWRKVSRCRQKEHQMCGPTSTKLFIPETLCETREK
ncbi:hypothetical protein FA10DRAFT_51668 [Acaromyces ingoldii]|uniref:Uncharacterized protein n=1 Tax=Acaromyces ingoldii TaxID=215250 RepID=A0A316YG43_9BASI|nr:hypothetical protein FA10DRAFT_51668 [Acaromyces ingoldii]PWN86715.1 hypothetical protein FA10DRAFT_51668 [Acaromyces ingoldii]